MRGPAAAALMAGIVLIVASPFVLLVLGMELMHCPNPGVCYDEPLWGSDLAALALFTSGLAFLVVARRLNRSVAAPEVPV